MGEELAEKLNGNMRIEIDLSQQLGSARQYLKSAYIQKLIMTKVSAGVLEILAIELKAMKPPFQFHDKTHLIASLFE